MAVNESSRVACRANAERLFSQLAKYAVSMWPPGEADPIGLFDMLAMSEPLCNLSEDRVSRLRIDLIAVWRRQWQEWPFYFRLKARGVSEHIGEADVYFRYMPCGYRPNR
ncbi:MAG: hypothetical protein ACYTBJ_16080 [Planctomycetota bacterium]|jgi:hypothetical protein